MKLIMVPVADRPECAIALDQAFRLADRLSSNIIGCHLRPHQSEIEKPGKSRFLLQFARAEKSAKPPTSRDIDLRCKAAKALFMAKVSQHGFQPVKRPRLGIERSARWIEKVGALGKLFPIIGPVTDLSVVSRPKHNAHGPGPEFLLSALLYSGKPVLILPQRTTAPVGKHILIAWNQSVEAARAVTAAMPLLWMADSVTICSCGPENRVGPKSTQLSEYLTTWGVKSKRVATKGRDAEKEIDATYRETGSDLIVMGAYSRSRMREIVFGGVTQHMLFETNKPVFALRS